jgi:hypothetical protein
MSTVASSVESIGATGTCAQTRDRFFLAMTGTLLLLVLIGFTPTLYMRALFPVPPIPTSLYVHGAVLTSWYVWLVMQAWLIQSGRLAAHRQLGVIGAALGVAVVGMAIFTTLNAVTRNAPPGGDFDADISTLGLGFSGTPIVVFAARQVWGNLAGVCAFATLFASAILLRGRPQVHKRLVLLAGMSIMGPAVTRIAQWPVLGSAGGAFGPIVGVSLWVAVVVHDLITTRRVHPATLIGIGLSIAIGVGQGLLLEFAPDLTQGFVRWLA